MRSEKPSEPYQFVLMSLDRDTGKVLWQKVAREEVPHEGHHPAHGFSSRSPATDGQKSYSFFGSRGLHCYDLQGNLKWEKDLGRMQTATALAKAVPLPSTEISSSLTGTTKVTISSSLSTSRPARNSGASRDRKRQPGPPR